MCLWVSKITCVHSVSDKHKHEVDGLLRGQGSDPVRWFWGSGGANLHDAAPATDVQVFSVAQGTSSH